MKKTNQKKFLFTIQISTLLKKNSTSGKKSIEPEDENPKADGSNENEEGVADANPEASTKKSTKAAKSTETNETGTDASVKDEQLDESDTDDVADAKEDEIETRIKLGFKSMSKSYIKLVCIHCNIKCLTFKVNSRN